MKQTCIDQLSTNENYIITSTQDTIPIYKD